MSESSGETQTNRSQTDRHTGGLTHTENELKKSGQNGREKAGGGGGRGLEGEREILLGVFMRGILVTVLF